MKQFVGWRLYALCLAGAAALLVVVRLFVLPWIDPTVASSLIAGVAQIIDSLIGAAGATAVLSVLASWVFRRQSPDLQATELIPSRSIARVLKELSTESRNWSYRGHTGRYFRTSVLPTLLATASQDGKFVDIAVQVLDPEDRECIDFFAKYRAEMNPDKVSYWTANQAVAEIVATIVGLSFARAASSRLSVNVQLGRLISPFTVDVADQGAVTTREKANQDAFMYRKGSTLYDTLVEDVVLSGRQARALSIPAAHVKTPKTVNDILNTIELVGLASLATPEIARKVLPILQNPVSPYA